MTRTDWTTTRVVAATTSKASYRLATADDRVARYALVVTPVVFIFTHSENQEMQTMKLHVVLRQSPGNSLLVLVATVCLAFTTFAQGKLLVGGMCVSDQKLTTTDPLGPFYIENSPMISTIAPAEFLVNNADVLSITGKVMGNDCVPLANARVEAWYAGEKDAFGEFYSASKYRGQQITDSCGNFKFIQTFPALYPGRPIPHIHYRVSSEDGTLLLVTQLYFEGAIPVFFNPDDTKISQIVNEADGSRSADFPIYVSIPGNVKNAENCKSYRYGCRLGQISLL